jgi:hypothetical protein
MAKSSKKTKEANAPGLTSPSAPGMEQPVAPKASAAKPAKAKKRPKAAGKHARSAAGKAAPARKPRTASATRNARSAGNVVISDEDIRIRAYFISEQRKQSGVAGNSAHDWLEACRQLQEEAGKSA